MIMLKDGVDMKHRSFLERRAWQTGADGTEPAIHQPPVDGSARSACVLSTAAAQVAYP